MGRWIPKWLAKSYARLLTSFGSLPFTSQDAQRAGVKKPNVVLPRLEKAGWVHRVARGRYLVAEPLSALLGPFGDDWRGRVRQKGLVPLLESTSSSLISGYGPRLKGVVLFGSAARGEAEPGSDVDLIVVADGMPPRYGDRVTEVMGIGSKGLRPEEVPGKGMVDFVLRDPTEFCVPSPFYLDVVHEGIVLYDKDGSTKAAMERLRREFERAGFARVQLPGGTWFWEAPLVRH